jgi:fido (protein-threonine AMPylation protein)
MARGRPSRQQLLESLDQARHDLMIIGGLPEPTVFRDVWAGIWTEETHNSTAIEGNTLRLKQVQLLLEDGVVSGSRNDLQEWLEAKAYGEAARWVYREAYRRNARAATHTSEAEIREIHRLVVESVWLYFPPEGLVRNERPGAYRLKDHDPLRPGLPAMSCSSLAPELAAWVEAANARRNSAQHPIEQLAELHARFERIHPFPDGNGRVGRLVLTALLVQAGYPPAIIYKNERTRYLTALGRADDGDYGPLTELLARSVREGIYRFLMPKLAGPLRIVPLAGLADEELTHWALVAAAQRGRLKAQKHNGSTWYSTRQWVEEYKATRYKQRRHEPSRA